MSPPDPRRRPLGFRVRILFAATALVFCAHAPAADPPAAPAGPALEASPSPQGILSHWLVAPAVKANWNELNEAPRGAREGQPGPGGGAWSLHASESVFLDLRQAQNGSRSGVVWCSALVKSLTGGRRQLGGYAYGALKVFAAGRLVLEKPPAAGDRPDAARVALDLPKGECEIAVAAGIRWGCRFALTLTGADGLKPVAGDALLLPLARGAEPDPGAVLAQSLSLSTANSGFFVKESQPVTLELGLRGGWPNGVGAVQPRFLSPAGKELDGLFGPRAADEISGKPWQATFQVAADPPGIQDLKCELLAAGTKKVLGAKTLRLYSLTGLRREAGRLERDVQAARAQASKRLPGAELAIEKLGLWFEKLQSGEEQATEEVGRTLAELLENGRACLQAEAAGRDPWAGRTGYFERAYLSPIDESPQPFFVQVPSAAKDFLARAPGKPEKKFPLVLFLHGYVPDYHKHRWWEPMLEFNAVFERQGVALAIPFGRSNADFLGPGEVDVLDVLSEMKRLYPIDEDRVYLYGYSMGAMAVYSLGGHYPDLWAAGIAIAGRADSPLLMRTGGLATLTPFKQFLIRTDQPIDLCENFVNLPLRIYHGSEDQFISPKEAQRMEARLKELGCDAKLAILPGNHWFGFDLMGDEELVKWLLEHKRDPSPKVRRLKNYSLRFGKAGPLYIEHLTGKMEPFNLEWSMSAAGFSWHRWEGPLGSLFLSRLPCKIVAPPGRADLKIEAGPPRDDHTEDGWLFQEGWHLPNGKNPLPELDKSSEYDHRCGPVKEATYGPFLIAYGTSGGEEAAKLLKAQAEYFAKEWYEFGKGRATVKADKDVTDEEKKTKNLFLFGEEQENLLHAAAAATKKLPFVVKDGKAEVGGKSVALKNRGILYIFPSPFEGAREDRSIVIAAGWYYGKYLGINHKLDLVPDFLVYTDKEDADGTGTNQPVVAGFFDGKWKLNAETTWWFDEK